MIEYTIENIIGYIKDDLGHEARNFRSLVKLLDESLKHSKFKRWSKISKIGKELFILTLVKYEGFVREFEGIRSIYQKGESFAHNQTKGKSKRFTPINICIHTIKFYLNRGNMVKAREEAINSLNFIKNLYSERTLYRMKKGIKDLGIDVSSTSRFK